MTVRQKQSNAITTLKYRALIHCLNIDVAVVYSSELNNIMINEVE